MNRQKVVNIIEMLIQALIFYSLIMYFIELQFSETENSREASARFFLWSERCVAILFTIEYLCRWYFAKNRLRYPFTAMAIVDFLAVIPFYVGFFIDLRSLRLIRTLRVLRLLKIYRYNEALQNFLISYNKVRSELWVLGVVIIIFIFLSGTLVFECERHAQPEMFGTLGDGLWWSVVTLTTVGYGDKFPITPVGKMAACVTLVFGLGIFGTFISLIGGAFIDTMQDKHTVKVWKKTQERLKQELRELGEPEDDELMQKLIHESVKSYCDAVDENTVSHVLDKVSLPTTSS